MTARRWILMTVGSVLAVVGVFATLAYAIDPYGVLRDSRGRKLAVFFSERRVKFLMNKRYVPTNFDGLIVGTSASSNWTIPTLLGYRIYNESLSGGNAAEERFLVDQGLSTGSYRFALLLLAPPMTSDHNLQDGLDAVKTSEALASFHLFVHEAAFTLLAMNRRFSKSETTPDGQYLFNFSQNFNLAPLEPTYFRIDPIAIGQYRSLIQSLQSRGAKIVYVVPPLYEPCYQLNRENYRAYLEAIRPLLPPAPIIDFENTEFNSLRADPDNFMDCFHVTPRGAANVSTLLETLIPRAFAIKN
jgi:hypothetical protein